MYYFSGTIKQTKKLNNNWLETFKGHTLPILQMQSAMILRTLSPYICRKSKLPVALFQASRLP